MCAPMDKIILSISDLFEVGGPKEIFCGLNVIHPLSLSLRPSNY